LIVQAVEHFARSKLAVASDIRGNAGRSLAEHIDYLAQGLKRNWVKTTPSLPTCRFAAL
jgi:hypothetical protein